MSATTGLKILHVEDNPSEQELIKAVFSDCRITSTDRESTALQLLRENQYDVVLLDLHLTEGDGFHLANQMRSESHSSLTPLIVVSGRTEVSDKVLALQIGADDYLTKPFNFLEIKARVEAVCRRQSLAIKSSKGPLHKGPFTLDPHKFEISVQLKDNKAVADLTGIEYKLMRYFLENSDQIVSRAQILDAVWGTGVHVIDRTVDAKISGLRKKLGPYSDSLKSIYGVGYKLSVEDARLDLEAA